jgi:hypothetical protein
MPTPIEPHQLNAIMEFDHVIRVHDDGTITEPTGIYAPELWDGTLDSDRWGFFTTGYSRQDSYAGPIMHNSELIGGGLARDILETPGVYVAVVSHYYTPDENDSDGDGETLAEGWAVAYLKE